MKILELLLNRMKIFSSNTAKIPRPDIDYRAKGFLQPNFGELFSSALSRTNSGPPL